MSRNGSSRNEERLRDLREANFPFAFRGYNRPEVDRFLGETAEWAEQLVAEGAETATVRHELERVGERTAGILAAAEDAARRMRSEAAREAEKLRSGARKGVETLRAEADQYAAEKRRQADSYATRTREAAETEARSKRLEAAKHLEEAIATAKRQSERMLEEALRRRNRLHAATEQLKQQRMQILDDTGALADELASVVATHAEITKRGPSQDGQAAEAKQDAEPGDGETQDMGAVSPDPKDPRSLLD